MYVELILVGQQGRRRTGDKVEKWDKLCTRKEDGGLGFRNFRLFNLAMLGKIDCRLITNPYALVCRVTRS